MVDERGGCGALDAWCYTALTARLTAADAFAKANQKVVLAEAFNTHTQRRANKGVTDTVESQSKKAASVTSHSHDESQPKTHS